MPEDQIQEIVDGIRTRLQAELETQLGTITERHAQAVDRARQVAEAEAEQRWTARLESTEAEWALRLDADITAARAEADREWQSKLESARTDADREWESKLASARTDAEREWESKLASARTDVDREWQSKADSTRTEADREWQAKVESTRTEWSKRLESEVAAARADADRRLAAESMRARIEAEQSAAAAAGTVRQELEAALEAERQQSQARIDAERQRVESELAEARAALDAERGQIQMLAAPAAVARSNGHLDAARLLEAMRTIDQAASLSDVLGSLAAAAAAEAPRVAVFVANGPQLEEWTVPALPALSAAPVRIAGQESGVLGGSLAGGEVQVAGGPGAAAPTFASLPPGRGAIAVPLKLGTETVAVLYADEGRDGDVASGWTEAIQILGHHGAARLSFLTAARTTQAMRLMSESAAASPSASRSDDDQGARRYARLLVSEIKLYNEAAVRVGREKRDLSRRLKPEIERARRLFDERIPQSASGRDDCFQQELVQTLADGDPSLLG